MIAGPWFRVSERAVDEFVSKLEDTISVSSLVSAFAPLLSPLSSAADRPLPISVVVLPCDEVTGAISPSASFILLRFRTSAAPHSMGLQTLRPVSFSLCSCACILPLQIDVSFSLTDLLPEASVCPDAITDLLAAELAGAFADILSAPLWSVDVTSSRAPVLLSNQSSPLCSYFSSGSLVYLQPLLPRVTRLHLLLSANACSRLSFASSCAELSSLCRLSPTASLAVRGNFVSAAVAPSSTPLCYITRFLSADAGSSLATRLVQTILDGTWGEDGAERPTPRGVSRGAKHVLPLRRFLWSFSRGDEACAAGEEKGTRENQLAQTNLHAVPMSYVDHSDGASKGDDRGAQREEDIVSVTETLDFLLGVSDPHPERDLVDGCLPQCLESSVLSYKKEVQDDTVRGENSLRGRQFWSKLATRLKDKTKNGRQSPKMGRTDHSTAVVRAALVVALFAVAFLFILSQFASESSWLLP